MNHAANIHTEQGWMGKAAVRLMASLLALMLFVGIAMANTTVVNCNAGQSLNSAIATLNKQVPNFVQVQGTCTEYIRITGFENLTVKGNPSATIVQPSTIPSKLFLTLLRQREDWKGAVPQSIAGGFRSSPLSVGNKRHARQELMH